MASSTTRSGLIPTSTKDVKFFRPRKPSGERLPTKFEASPIVLALRPYGGLINPFPKRCSVLCNHPAPTAIKNVIHQLRTSWASEAKHSYRHQQQHLLETKAMATDVVHRCPYQSHAHEAMHDNIPEDLFRRYTDSDSRPLTPSPTVTSVRTRTSAGSFLNNRRCITPEFGKNEIIKRKKIILDLRRSHSQETLYWKPSSELSQSNIDADSATVKPKSADAHDERKSKQQRFEEQHAKSMLGVSSSSPDEKCNGDDSPTKRATSTSPQTCINEHQMDDADIRRGKKRKKIKPAAAANTATFHMSEDPETQVAALGPDSLNPSTRPSLIPKATINLLPSREKRESNAVLLKGSFLTDDAFQALKTELDVDIIENTFEKYLNRALREAIKYMPAKAFMTEAASKANVLDMNKPLLPSALQDQTKMPRKFSKSATRFDVPIDMKAMESMTVLEYLSKYVWVSRQRKQLYKRVFLKYISRDTDDGPNPSMTQYQMNDRTNPDEDQYDENVSQFQYKDRKILMECLPKALEDVLEFHGTEKNISTLLRILQYDEYKCNELDFRTWCGIVSFAERLALSDPTEAENSSDELEKADFSSLEQLMMGYKIAENLKFVFQTIRRTHNS